MAEYIERDRARFEFERFFKDKKDVQGDCDSLLCTLPAADVAPVVHGRWEKNDYNQTVCSHCKVPIPGYWGQYEGCPYGVWTEIEPTICCHNFGAKMDGGKHETD